MREEKSLFENVDCVSFKVDELDEGIRFYCDGLGLKLLWRTEVACGLGMDNDKTEVVLTTAAENTVVQFRVENVAQAVKKFIEVGGKIVVPEFEIDIGKCAVVVDKWGNEYCLLDMSKGEYVTDDTGKVTGVKNIL